MFLLIVDAIREILPELPARALRSDDSLDALGAGSMDRADILMTVLDRMNLHIPLVETLGPKNLGELAALLSKRVA